MTPAIVTKATYVQLGTSGLRISNPILGAMSFGEANWMAWCLDETIALPILKSAYDQGINTWDTSNNYSNGLSEKIIAKAIKTYQIPRENLVIMTKCFFPVGEEGKAYQMIPPAQNTSTINKSGLSRSAIFSAVDASLKRLETDYIDLLQIHRFDPTTRPEETMRALDDLVRSGKVRYIGASSMWAWQFALLQHTAELHGWTKFISMQNQYSLLYREEEREMIPYCKATGVGLIPWAPLARGHLARSHAKPTESSRHTAEDGYTDYKVLWEMGSTEMDLAIIKRVEEIAEKKGWSMATVSLAWVNGKIDSPIVGLSSAKRAVEAVEAADKRLEPEEVAYLEELYSPRMIIGH